MIATEGFDRFSELLDTQQSVIRELQSRLENLKREDFYKKNGQLEAELGKLSDKYGAVLSENKRLLGENARLKNELFEQMFNEKVKLLEITEQRIDVYFASSVAGEANRLASFEAASRARMDHISAQVNALRLGAEHNIYAKLSELQAEVWNESERVRQELYRQHGMLMKDKAATFNSFRQEPPTDSEILRRAKQNNLETFFGLKIFNKLGILLIIIGVIAAAQFTFVRLPDLAKGLFIFALGLIMLAAGEIMNNRGRNVFSIGLTAGGVGVLYAGVALSFFLLGIMNAYVALVVCVLVSSAAFFLSYRYDAQTIAAFALVGGYLPVFSIGSDRSIPFFMMGFILALNIFALVIACGKKWRITQSIGFGLNVFATVYIVFRLASLGAGNMPTFGMIACFYVFAANIIYSLIPLTSSFFTGEKLRGADIALLSVNTVLYSLIMFLVFLGFGMRGRMGYMAAVFAVIYFGLSGLIKLKMPSEKGAIVLFYITGLTFTALTIPFQFDIVYLSLGWLLEGTLLLIYGILSEKRSFRLPGWIIGGLCLFVFIFFDLPFQSEYFFFKFAAITAASLAVLAARIYKQERFLENTYKCSALSVAFVFMIYALFNKLTPLLGSGLSAYALTLSACIVSGLLFGYAIGKIGPLACRAVSIMSSVIYGLSILALLGSNLIYWENYTPGFQLAFAATVSLAANLLAVLAVREMALKIVLAGRIKFEWYPLILSGVFVLLLLQNMVVQLNLPLTGSLITLVLALTSIGWIIFGFVRRYRYIRLSGLILSFATVVKLFVIDLFALTSGLRIASYFGMGIALLAISFVYQFFSKRLRLTSQEADVGKE